MSSTRHTQRTRRAPRQWACALFVASLLGSAPCLADTWKDHYDEAERALRNEDWEKAVDELNRAIGLRSESGTRVRTYGMNFDPYFPYLKLGIAHYGLGHLDAALNAFEIEEQYGAIKEDKPEARSAWAELTRYRSLVTGAREAARREEERRIADIVRQSLAEARRLEGEGRLDEAIAALGRGQSVEPESAPINGALERIRRELRERQNRQDRVARTAALVAEGRTLLGEGKYGEASRLARQALQLDPAVAEARALFDDAQAGLRREAEKEQDSAERRRRVSEGMARARQLGEAGQLDKALDRLEEVLALEPGLDAALTLQRRWLERKAEADAEGSRQTALERLLAEVRADFDAGRAEQSLATANRVLGLDPGNLEALGYRSRAFQQISRALLGTGARQNTPPAIDFVDFRQETEDGSLVERVRDPEFQLSGVVFDNTEVEDVVVVAAAGEVPVTTTVQDVGGGFFITQFRFQTRLPAGLSVFEFAASDPEGLSSRGEYQVLYERPWFRSPLVRGGAAGTALGLVGFVFWRRARRLRRRRERRYNPYVAGAPVLDEELFFGRRELVDRILQTVHNNSLLLYGERRIGKTSLQHYLKKRLSELRDPRYDFYPVYVDLQGTPEEKFFSTLAEDVFLELAPHLDGLEPTERDDYGYRELVRDLRKVIRTLREKSEKTVKVVLLIDEVDELNDYDPKINQKLRSLFMKSFAEHLVTVVSGVAIKKQWEREGSPWYNFFEEIEIKPLEENEARELVERPIRGLFKLEDGLAERVIELTGARPYLIQKMLIALVNRLYEEGRRTITLADVEAVGRLEEAT